MRKILRLMALFFIFAPAGCAFNRSTPSLASASAGISPLPLVRNCAVLQTGSPSRFACNGRIYTSFQLAKLREDAAKGSTAAQPASNLDLAYSGGIQ